MKIASASNVVGDRNPTEHLMYVVKCFKGKYWYAAFHLSASSAAQDGAGCRIHCSTAWGGNSKHYITLLAGSHSVRNSMRWCIMLTDIFIKLVIIHHSEHCSLRCVQRNNASFWHGKCVWTLIPLPYSANLKRADTWIIPFILLQ